MNYSIFTVSTAVQVETGLAVARIFIAGREGFRAAP
jgi:hypothetical protein